MDKNEQQDILKTIKVMYNAENFHGILALVRDMHLDRIKDRRVLEMIAEAYERSGLYEDAREALLIAYEKFQQSRSLAYRLTEISVKIGNLDDAVDFYEDYCRLAPNDNSRYILKYMIGKAGGIETGELIKVLEKYTAREMDEQWLYELARLYHEEGRADECVALCDEIALWYADGDYEKAALELKFTHKALSPVQQARYEEIMGEYVDSEPEIEIEDEAEEKEALEEEAEVFASSFLGQEPEIPEPGLPETELSGPEPEPEEAEPAEEKPEEAKDGEPEEASAAGRVFDSESFAIPKGKIEEVIDAEAKNRLEETKIIYKRKAAPLKIGRPAAPRTDIPIVRPQEIAPVTAGISKTAAAKIGDASVTLSPKAVLVKKPELNAQPLSKKRARAEEESRPEFMEEPVLKDKVDISDIPIAKEEDGQVGINLVLIDRNVDETIEGQITLDEFFREYAGLVRENKEEVAAVEAERLRQIVAAVSDMKPTPLFDVSFETPFSEEFSEEEIEGNAAEQELVIKDAETGQVQNDLGAEEAQAAEEAAEAVSEEVTEEAAAAEETPEEEAAEAAEEELQEEETAEAAEEEAQEEEAAEAAEETVSEEVSEEVTEEEAAEEPAEAVTEGAAEVITEEAPEEEAAEEAEEATEATEEAAPDKEVTEAAAEEVPEEETAEAAAEEMPEEETAAETLSAPETDTAAQAPAGNVPPIDENVLSELFDEAFDEIRMAAEDAQAAEAGADESEPVPENEPEEEAEPEISRGEPAGMPGVTEKISKEELNEALRAAGEAEGTSAEEKPEKGPDSELDDLDADIAAAIARFEKSMGDNRSAKAGDDVLGGLGEDIEALVSGDGQADENSGSPEAAGPKFRLSEESKEEMKEFLLIPGMQEEIERACATIIEKKRMGDTSGGNLIVTGDKKSGKTYLAIAIIKAVVKELGTGSRKVVKVQSQPLNGKNIEAVFEKIGGRDLIIENVGYLEDNTIDDIIYEIKEGGARQMIVLEGNNVAIETILVHFPEIRSLFTSRVNIEELTITQWADIAKKYAKEQGYVIDDMAILALHARIDKINVATARIGLGDIRDIVDSAIAKASKRNNGKLFATFSKKGKEEIKLLEGDFL